MWTHYVSARKATDLQTVHDLIIVDQLQKCVDKEILTQIKSTLGSNEWLRPKELASKADNMVIAKNGTFAISRWPKETGQSSTAKNWRANHSEKRNNGDSQKEVTRNTWEAKKETKRTGNFNSAGPKQCFLCQSERHFFKDCPQRNTFQAKGGKQSIPKVKANFVGVSSQESSQMPEGSIIARMGIFNCKNLEESETKTMRLETGELKHVNMSIEGNIVSGILDSGCELPVVKGSVISHKNWQPQAYIYVQPAIGKVEKLPLVTFNVAILEDGVSPPVAHSELLCAVAEDLCENFLLPPDIYEKLRFGDGPKCMEVEEKANDGVKFVSELRVGVARAVDPEKIEEGTDTPECKPISENETSLVVNESLSDVFRRQQENCDSISKNWEDAKESKNGYEIRDHLLFHREKVLGETVFQLVVPEVRRREIMELAHKTVFGGHMGAKKTCERIRYTFYWEGLSKEVRQFCEACHECQLRRKVKVSDRAPISPVARPNFPFEIVNIDCIGPLNPPSTGGHKYVLCLVDVHTRWAEAVPLRSLTAKSTCEALMSIFMRTGIPKVIASDNGTNFNCDLTREFEKRLGCCPRFSTPGYPQANGLVEKFNQTLKNMLHHVFRENVRDWHKQLPYILWAYREIPNSTTGVSPFQMLYGRQPVGPLSILKTTWTGQTTAAVLDTTPVSKYLKELKERLEEAAESAKLTANIQQERMAHYYNLRSTNKDYRVGDKVVVLIPDSTNKLYSRWKGPGTIIKHNQPHTYVVQLEDGTKCHVHQNKIRKYIVNASALNVIFEGDEEFGTVQSVPVSLDKRKESLKDVVSAIDFSHLGKEQSARLKQLLTKYPEVFSDKLKPAKVEGHKIELLEGIVRKKPHCYRVPEAFKAEVDRQVKELLADGLIEPSTAEIAYPIVCVAKKDTTLRLCIDYRSLNIASKVQTFPMQNSQELMYMAGKANWLTTIDLLRGYWQIPMEAESRQLTSFATHSGVYRWNVMPFGLQGAAATFQKVINEVLTEHSEYAQAYIDDIVIFSNTWEQHLEHVNAVLKELSTREFTARVDKCSFAQKEIKFLGHKIGSGKHSPDEEKVRAIRELKTPSTKKEVKSVLGLMGFYRSYVPRYAEIALPLTELTKKKAPFRVSWSPKAEAAFQTLKNELCKVTALSVPDPSKPFQIHTDASQLAVAACLTQKDGNKFKPIAFASKKLDATQGKWAPIEQEAYAVLFGLKKFENWVFGSKVEIITDHNPLRFLTQTTPKSPKLTRWALALQRWDLEITHRPGKLHLNADAISRLSREGWDDEDEKLE